MYVHAYNAYMMIRVRSTEYSSIRMPRSTKLKKRKICDLSTFHYLPDVGESLHRNMNRTVLMVMRIIK